jgi:pyruvate formate lyase activating enzyme
MEEARYWHVEGDRARCELCPHRCLIPPTRSGICGVRQNVQGKLMALTYGMVSSMHVDPMEKKPFYHFKPGQTVLSLGSVGCNLGCLHCQNYSISQAAPDSPLLQRLDAAQVPDMVRRAGCGGVSWTYNEPTIWFEFASDASKLCKREGLFTNFVSNGYIQEGPLRDLQGVVDAINIDVKGFTDDFYRKVCKATLQPVLDAVMVAHEIGMHVELTYLIIPSKNDGEGQIAAFSEWVADLDDEMPVHFSRFHPDYKMMDVPPTPAKTMDRAYQVAKGSGLKFVYLDNLRSDAENTICPDCGSLVIRRSWYDVEKVNYHNGRCGKCGRELHMVP